MKITFGDKIIAWMALLSGLTISAVAIWYSVAGLVSIFAAAVVPIIVMGVALEVSKLIATVWLKLNWNRAPVFIRTYLLVAIAILMVITSMGIFGFLSKAHSDQSLVSGDVQSKIAVFDEQIKTERENIESGRKQLKQMDEAVDQVMARSKDERGANNANAIRQRQLKDRQQIAKDITASQKKIAALQEERAPIAAEVRKVEAEVGPIKYIAAFIYGDNPDANLLEKAVTWVIIIIVSVFDPLAVILLLASQYSFQWFRKAREEEEDDLKEVKDWFDQGKERARQLDEEAAEQEPTTKAEPFIPAGSPLWPFPATPYIREPIETPVEETAPVEEQPTPEVEELDDHGEIDDDDSDEVKAAKTAWKHDHPNDSLKRHRRLFESGIINKLPWEAYLPEKTINDNEAAEEAAKWAEEQLQKSAEETEVTKKDGIVWMENENGQQVKKSQDGYQQNAEQSESTIWQRVKKTKGE